LKDKLVISNTSRELGWNGYIENLMLHRNILNPIGILRGLNTRAYETLYSGRVLLQHAVGEYQRHENLLKDNPGIIFFNDFEDLKKKANRLKEIKTDSDFSFTQSSFHTRMKSIGLDIK
jgi:hypothetical protein